jgi:hypothetical protein
MIRPLVPKDWKTTQAICEAKKPLLERYKRGGKQHPIFNGSQNNPNNKKRPITLPNTATKSAVDKGDKCDLK